MSLQMFNYGVNVVAFSKDNKNYGMTCSWAMQVDYDKICMLIGEQSVTGKKINEGDIIGVSVLNENQIDIGKIFGEGHSDQCDKFKDIAYTKNQNAILIHDSKITATIEVIEIIRLKGIEEDSLVYGKVLDITEKECQFLSLDKLKK